MQNLLQQEYLGLEGFVWLRFFVIFGLAVFLKKNISRVFTAVFYFVFKRYAKGPYGQKFKTLVEAPMQGWLLTILFYIALNQIYELFEGVLLFQRNALTLSDGTTKPASAVSLIEIIDHIFFLFLIYYTTLLVTRVIDFIILVRLEKAQQMHEKDKMQILPLLKDVVKVILWVVGFFSILGVVFHVNVATLIAGLGIGGLALAFAAKDSLENLISSFLVIVDKPFSIGDWIRTDGVEGTVEKIGFRSTRIRAFDKSLVMIPNKNMIDGNLENFSERGSRRVKFNIGLNYGLSQHAIRTIQSSILDLLENHPAILPNPSVVFDSFGDSSINLSLVYYIRLHAGYRFEQVKEEINFGIYKTVYKYGKGFPFPTQTTIQGTEISDVETEL